MPTSRFPLMCALAVSLALLAADLVRAQPPGRGPGGGGDRGGSREGGDRGGRGGGFGRFGGGGGEDSGDRASRIAEMIFSRYSGGGDEIVIEDAQEDLRERLEQFAESAGIRNGRITREQFTQYIQDRMAARSGGGDSSSSGGSSSRSSGRPGSSRPGSSRSGSSGGERSRGDSDDRGRLEFDPRWFEDPEPEPEKRPTVFNAGNLPEQLKSGWFAQMDKDRDGQVALFEWRSADRSTADFRKVDVNADGFATPEEALRSMGISPLEALAKKAETGGSDSRGSSRGDSGRSGFTRGGSSGDRSSGGSTRTGSGRAGFDPSQFRRPGGGGFDPSQFRRPGGGGFDPSQFRRPGGSGFPSRGTGGTGGRRTRGGSRGGGR